MKDRRSYPPISLRILLILFYGIFEFLSLSNTFAQATKIRGKITDSETGEPLPFVNVAFSGKPIGTISDFNGEYFIETQNASDTIRVSYIGYKPQSYRIQKNIFQEINFELQPDQIQIAEIIIHKGENPAHPILRNIISNKQKNNPREFDSYFFETYNKVELDINNIDDRFMRQRVLRPFQFVFEHLDTSVVTGKPYLPAFITETVSDYYYRQNPMEEKEVIHASKVSGIENESLSQITGNIFQDLNIYDNFLKVLNQGLISPISDNGLLYYKYYLIDSAFINHRWCYEISFQPRRKQEPTFTGNFWVHDTTFAIVKIQLRLAEDVNLNFVNDIVGMEEYQMVNDSLWFAKQQDLFVDFNLNDKATGFFGRKKTTYSKIHINEPFPPEVRKIRDKVTVTSDALNENSEYWAVNRPGDLTEQEETIYGMIDSVQSVPEYDQLETLIQMFVTGYYVTGLFEIGPVYTIYSFNDIEGKRFRLGGRTSNDFSTKLMIEGHVAYGLQDDRFKYGGGFLYLFNKNPRIGISGSYTHDIEQLGESPYAFKQDNIIASYLRRNPNYKLTLVDNYSLNFEKEWIQGFSNELSFNHKRIYATEYIPFTIPQDTGFLSLEEIKNTEIKLNTRYAKGERYIMGEFLRTSLGTKYPVLNIDFSVGLKNILESEYNYLKIKLSVSQKVSIHPLGYFKYILESGKIFGTLPYPLLHLHEGNETYAFDKYSFNMMNYYEFASDQYISLFLEHHFQGMFLNKIPLIRRLNWREVVYAKGVIGSLDSGHRDLMEYPEGLTSLENPYIETGAGIENIFKFFRVSAIWRLTHLDHNDIQKFGLRFTFQVIF